MARSELGQMIAAHHVEVDQKTLYVSGLLTTQLNGNSHERLESLHGRIPIVVTYKPLVDESELKTGIVSQHHIQSERPATAEEALVLVEKATDAIAAHHQKPGVNGKENSASIAKTLVKQTERAILARVQTEADAEPAGEQLGRLYEAEITMKERGIIFDVSKMI